MVTTADAEPDRRAGRRELLLDAIDRAIRLHGPDASMEALAAEAGITKPILYRHFGDKRGLLLAHAHRHATRLARRITDELATRRTPRARIRATIDTYLAALEDDPQTYWFIARRAGTEGSDVHAALDDVVDRVTDAVARTLEEELATVGAPTDAATTWARALVGMVQLVGDRWLRTRDQPREVVVDRLADLVWLGFRGLAGR